MPCSPSSTQWFLVPFHLCPVSTPLKSRTSRTVIRREDRPLVPANTLNKEPGVCTCLIWREESLSEAWML